MLTDFFPDRPRQLFAGTPPVPKFQCTPSSAAGNPPYNNMRSRKKVSWQNSRNTDIQYKYRTSLDSSHAQDSEKVRYMYAHSRRNLEKQVMGLWQRYSTVHVPVLVLVLTDCMACCMVRTWESPKIMARMKYSTCGTAVDHTLSLTRVKVRG